MVITTAVALVTPLVVIVIVVLLAGGAQPAIQQFGVQFLVSSAWNPVKQQFGADPLYIRLCRAQECFRARLTPKPWRCRVGLPPASFPFTTSKEEQRFREWEANYSSTTAQYATCRYLASFGAGRIEDELDELITYHDQETRSASALPLA